VGTSEAEAALYNVNTPSPAGRSVKGAPRPHVVREEEPGPCVAQQRVLGPRVAWEEAPRPRVALRVWRGRRHGQKTEIASLRIRSRGGGVGEIQLVEHMSGDEDSARGEVEATAAE
jgi:hypothetical protein